MSGARSGRTWRTSDAREPPPATPPSRRSLSRQGACRLLNDVESWSSPRWMVEGVDDALVDRAEQRQVGSVRARLHPHALAEREKRRRGSAAVDDLDRAPLGDAARAVAAIAAVRDRARADDRAGAERARARGMRDQLVEAVDRLGGGHRAERLVVPPHLERRGDTVVGPRALKLVRRHG